jgi:hypothetical protein
MVCAPFDLGGDLAPPAAASRSTSSTTAYAWNTLIDQPWKIMSIALRDWAAVGHSL